VFWQPSPTNSLITHRAITSQRGPLISPKKFDNLFAPKKKEFFDMVHSYGAKISHHCCGSSLELIPNFIKIGMDVLQTIGKLVRFRAHF